LADIVLRRGAPVIKTEASRPNAWVYVDLNTSDVGGFVAQARRLLDDRIAMPPGYTLTWSGQYEYMERAASRLRVVIPLTLFLMFLLLYLNFRNVISPALVMLSVPFGLVGGFWLVYWYGYNISVAVAVGFIALAGVAVETGVLVLTFIQQAVSEARTAKRDRSDAGISIALTSDEIAEAVQQGTSRRVRAVMMTATSTIVGLLPIMLITGAGSDVMRRIAAPMIGGMITTMILCLLVLPVIYSLVLQFREGRRKPIAY